jgi:hypothetical protein
MEYIMALDSPDVERSHHHYFFLSVSDSYRDGTENYKLSVFQLTTNGDKVTDQFMVLHETEHCGLYRLYSIRVVKPRRQYLKLSQRLNAVTSSYVITSCVLTQLITLEDFVAEVVMGCVFCYDGEHQNEGRILVGRLPCGILRKIRNDNIKIDLGK